MGRTRIFDTVAVAEVLTDLVLRYGYDAVGIEDIVRSSGVGRGSLYQAFGSKAGMIQCALEQAVEHRREDRIEFAALILASSAIDDSRVRQSLERCLASVPAASLERSLGRALLQRVKQKET